VPGTLVLAEHLRGQVREITLECTTAAKELDGPLTVCLVASDPSALVEAVNVAGVDEIACVRVESDEFSSEAYVDTAAALVAEKKPGAVLCGFTVNGMGYAPALAARLDLGFASDVVAFHRDDGSLVAERELYGAKVRAELEFPGKDCVVLMLRPTTWEPAGDIGSATVSELAVETSTRSRHREFVEAQTGDVDITTADFLLSIGRGIGDKENIEQFEQLAGTMGATLGVSRPIVDAGWMPSSRQVGQSGKTVKPKVYLAFGISGAVQHLAGMKTSGTIIAINTDHEAAIFNVAHYGAACDLFEVAEELEKLY
jgi:electron transfer flavoprotein alpha subunit